MIIDGHTHIGFDEINTYLKGKPKGQTPEELLIKMEEMGVDAAVIFPCPAPVYFDPASCNDKEHPMRLSGRDIYSYNLENAYVLYAASHYKNFIPFLAIYPHDDNHIKAIEDIVKSNGQVKGLKFHGWTMHTPITDLIGSKLMEIAEDNNLAVTVHTEAADRWEGYARRYTNPMQAVELAKAHPNAKVIAAHMGNLSTEFLECLAEQENLYTDCGPFLWEYQSINKAKSFKHMNISKYTPPKLLEELDRKFPRKIIWSTDEPWTAMAGMTYEDEVDVLDEIAEKVKHRIAEENISRVLGL